MTRGAAHARRAGGALAALCGACTLAASAPLSAAGTLEEHVVTARRIGRGLDELPYRVEAVSATDLEQRGPRSLPDALAEAPGVMVQKTAQGQGSPYIRGFTGYRTLALIDGVRYNNSVYRDGPSEYFALIDAESMARVEVLNGPDSVHQGSDAVGGVVSVESERSRYAEETVGRAFLHGSQRYQFTSADRGHLARTELDTGAGATWGLRLGYSTKDFGDVHAAGIGRQPRTGYDEQGFDARLDVALAPGWRLTGLHQRLAQDDVWRTHATRFARPYKGSAVGSDRLRAKDQARRFSYLRLERAPGLHALDDLRLTVSHQAWQEDGQRVRRNGRGLDERFKSNMGGVDLELASHWGPVGLRYGVDYYQDNVDSFGAEIGADGRLRGINVQGPLGDDALYGLFGAWLQAEIALTPRLGVIAGSRYNHVRAEIGRYEDPLTGAPASFDDDWQRTVHALRLQYAYSEAPLRQRVWVGVSQAFRAPNIADLSRFGASRSNEVERAAVSLAPEDFLSFELGWAGRWHAWSGGVTLFHTRIHDYIASTPTGRVVDGAIEVSKRNTASGYVRGVELSTAYAFAEHWSLRGNLAWQRGRIDAFASTTTRVSYREPLSRIMPLTGNLRLAWRSGDARSWVSAGLTVTGRADELSEADRNDPERIPPGGTPGYVLAGVHAGHALNAHVKLLAGIDNLFDDAYRVHGSGSNEAGLGARVGMEVGF